MERSIINTRQPHTTINCMFPCVTSTIALRDYRMAHSSKRAMSIIKAITQPSMRASTKGKWNVKFDSRRLSTIIHWVSIIDFWTRFSISLFIRPPLGWSMATISITSRRSTTNMRHQSTVILLMLSMIRAIMCWNRRLIRHSRSFRQRIRLNLTMALRW